MSLAERRWLRLFTLCVMYVAQGIPYGFLASTLPIVLGKRLEAQGLGDSAIAGLIGGVVAMSSLPYAFKWVWGPVMDVITFPRLGRRRPWILLAQGMMALTIGVMIAIPDLTANLGLLGAMIFIHTIFNSMQDVAVDALAIDLLSEEERGRTNGLMYGCKYLGSSIGGIGMAQLLPLIGLRGALAVQTALLGAIMLVPLLVRETDRPPPAPVAFTPVLRALVAAFSRAATIAGAAVALLATLGASLLQPNATVLFERYLHWSADDLASLTGGPGQWAGLAGAVAGGFLADKVGHRKLAALGCVVLAATWLGWAAAEPYWTNHTLVYALALLEPFAQAIVTVSLFAVFMDICAPEIAATQFAAYMALFSVALSRGAKYGHVLLDHFTFRGIYIVVAMIQLSVIALLPLLTPKQPENAGSGRHSR